MTPDDLAPDLAPTSPPGGCGTTSPLAPSPVGGEVVTHLAPRPRPGPTSRTPGSARRVYHLELVVTDEPAATFAWRFLTDVLELSESEQHMSVLCVTPCLLNPQEPNP
jgi:hypothetical protein